MYDTKNGTRFLTDKQWWCLADFLQQKGVDDKTTTEFLHMDYDNMVEFYELYLADTETDLDIFYNILRADDDMLRDFNLSPCKAKRCVCYDEYNNFCKHYCMDVSGLKLYDVLNCKGDIAYLRQGFGALKEEML